MPAAGVERALAAAGLISRAGGILARLQAKAPCLKVIFRPESHRLG
jgi:hypothetical protein